MHVLLLMWIKYFSFVCFGLGISSPYGSLPCHSSWCLVFYPYKLLQVSFSSYFKINTRISLVAMSLCPVYIKWQDGDSLHILDVFGVPYWVCFLMVNFIGRSFIYYPSKLDTVLNLISCLLSAYILKWSYIHSYIRYVFWHLNLLFWRIALQFEINPEFR